MPASFNDRNQLRPTRSDDKAVRSIYEWARRLLRSHTAVPTTAAASSDPIPIVWTALSSNPALGNGTLDCEVREFGDLVFIRLQLTIGSSTTQGTGAWVFSLPYASLPDIEQSLHGHIHHTGGGGAETAVNAVVSTAGIRPIVDGSGNRISVTTAMATADTLVLQGYYRPA